ncbi:tyrosine-type recombinase/integrase [Siminovitchia fordii]|uniref:Tyr recombinase domain-containing protein n=1 Tax=Siminovitchia fordii TaxID=254759 RepID=A0ABQ4KCU1_9BACI|nr:tyrosine-type recombinase/integrase [Siminovitchia fordii]GIN22866.1 hypothetical protein J1TS3_40000 [Siminovitchia fordii]
MQSNEFKELGLKRIRFHDLRHSSLTYLSTKGIRPKAVQKRAGHTRIVTTFDITDIPLLRRIKKLHLTSMVSLINRLIKVKKSI